ncbi:MAG: hypothetical protein AB7G62_06750 [Magnetospirillum sp.]
MTDRGLRSTWFCGLLVKLEFLLWSFAFLLPGITAFDWLNGKDVMLAKTMMMSAVYLAGALIVRMIRKKSKARNLIIFSTLIIIVYALFLIFFMVWLER